FPRYRARIYLLRRDPVRLCACRSDARPGRRLFHLQLHGLGGHFPGLFQNRRQARHRRESRWRQRRLACRRADRRRGSLHRLHDHLHPSGVVRDRRLRLWRRLLCLRRVAFRGCLFGFSRAMKTIIVGAGVAGLSIGWKLAQAGVDVLILDRARPARGATWAAAGMIAPTAEGAHADAAEIAFARWSAELWPHFAAQVEAQSGHRIGYKRDGALMVAMTGDEARELRAQSNKILLTADEAQAREP